MVKYYSAISEFFRVCRVGGRIIIIEEPHSEPDLADAALLESPDDFPVYGAICLGDLRRRRGLPSVASSGTSGGAPIDFSRLEAIIAFCTGVNPAVTQPLIERLAAAATLSVVARKPRETTVLRSRHDLKASTTDAVS